MTLAQIDRELRSINDQINALYWTFTRCARGKPPVVVRPDLYARREELNAIRERLREVARKRRARRRIRRGIGSEP